MNNTVSTSKAEHYTWGNGCDGWFLAKSEEMHVIQERMPAGTAEVRHYHNRSRQFFYVLLGELTMEMEGCTTRVGAGEGIEITPGTRHQARNESDGEIEFLVMSCPPSHGDRVDVG